MANSHPDMHLDTRTGKWVYEDAKTGQEYEWNTTANAWVPVVDDDLMEAQQKAYSVAGVDESVSRALDRNRHTCSFTTDTGYLKMLRMESGRR